METGRSPTPPPFGPYGGRTGAEENFQRDMQFAMAGPEDRAPMLGMNPYASADLGRDDESITEVGYTKQSTYISHPVWDGLGVDNFVLDTNRTGHIANRHFSNLEDVSTFALGFQNESALFNQIVVPALSNPRRLIFDPEGTRIQVFADLPYTVGTDANKRNTQTVQITLMRGSSLGELRIITAFPVPQGFRGQ